MTLKGLIERIQQEFPDIKSAQIVNELNEIQKDYCIETNVLKKSDTLAIEADKVTYTLSEEFSTLDKILRVDFLDSDGNPVNETDKLKMDIKPDGGITFYDYYGQAISSISGDISTITFYFTYTPALLSVSTLTAIPNIPDQLHDALIHGVLARLHSRIPTLVKTFSDNSIMKVKDFQSVQYNETKYKEYIIKGKKWANTGKSLLTSQTKQDSF